jgi:nitrite reductase/ring-hydroxylating ferredoxin subunit
LAVTKDRDLRSASSPDRQPPALLTGKTLMCQCDGSQFDVTTGRVLRGPATQPLVLHEVSEKGGDIQFRI